jgi:hypothetical protein
MGVNTCTLNGAGYVCDCPSVEYTLEQDTDPATGVVTESCRKLCPAMSSMGVLDVGWYKTC